MSSIKRRLCRQKENWPQKNKKSRFHTRLVIKICICIFCVFIYFLCLYAALTGKIAYLQIYAERMTTKGIPGYHWMLIGIMAAGGYGLLNHHLFDTFSIWKWRKKHPKWLFTIDIAIPCIILIVLDLYIEDNGFFSIIGMIVVISILFICANFKEIIKRIKAFLLKKQIYSSQSNRKGEYTMKEYHITNIKDARFEFETKSKRKILDVINIKGKMPYKVKEQDLILINNKMSLPIELSKWKDIDDDSDFTNVLKTLKKITDIKGGSPLLVIAVKVVGYDLERNLHFTFVNQFVDGRHAIVGRYENEMTMVYTNTLYLK